MTASRDKPSRYSITEDPLAFFGAVTASVSHELNNVISIIDQTAGLQADMIAGEERGIPIALERLNQSVNSIIRQTQRGLEIIQRLNRFAHTADFPETEFEVNEVVSNLVELARRLADLKRANLEFKKMPQELNIIANPFILQHALFDTLRFVLRSAESDDTIEIALKPVDARIEFTIETPRLISKSDPDLGIIRSSLKRIAGELQLENNEESTLIRILVPVGKNG